MGLSGLGVACVEDAGGVRHVVKWAVRGGDGVLAPEDLDRVVVEAQHAGLLAGAVLPVELVDHTRGVLVTPWRGRSVRAWTPALITQSQLVLDQLAAQSVQVGGAAADQRIRTFLKKPLGLDELTGVEPGLGRLLAEMAAGASGLDRCALAHGDAHPGNWVELDGALTLIDYEWLGLYPPGFDRAFLAAFLGLDGRVLVEGVPDALVLVGAVAAWLHRASWEVARAPAAFARRWRPGALELFLALAS